MLTKLTPIETASEIIYQRHIIQKLRREMTYTRRPDLVQNGIDHARLVEEAVRILKKNVPGKFEHVQVKAELTVRASTAPVAS